LPPQKISYQGGEFFECIIVLALILVDIAQAVHQLIESLLVDWDTNLMYTMAGDAP
jgi:hypothetical protein